MWGSLGCNGLQTIAKPAWNCNGLQTIAKPTAFVSDRWSEREIMDDYLYAV